MGTVSKKVSSNLLWRLLERFGAQAVTLIVSIVLARLLDPSVYGLIALVTIFITILQVFVDSGFGVALIQKKDSDDLDFSSVFYFNVVSCSILYTILFFLSPLIAGFYEQPDLIPVIRVLGLTIIVSGVKNIQQAYVSKNLLFKRFFFATLGGTIGAAVVGITLAYLGYGVWALVAQHLFNLIVDTIILWITVKWRPKLMFSFTRLKILFSFGWKLLISALLDTGYKELCALIIGKKYSAEDLAYYNRGQQFPSIIVTNINSSIDSVLLPTMSSEQDNAIRVRSMTRRAIKTSTFIMMPMMVGLAVCADSVVMLLLTEKWMPAVFFLRIFCFVYAFYPIHTANLNAIKAMGRSDLFLTLEIIKKVTGLIAIISTMFISVEAMAYSLLITSVIHQIINAWPNKKLLNYTYIDQIKDMLPQIGIALLMGGVVYCAKFLPVVYWIRLIIQIPVGIVIYFGLSKLFKVDSFDYIINIAKGYFHRKATNNCVDTNNTDISSAETDITTIKDGNGDNDND